MKKFSILVSILSLYVFIAAAQDAATNLVFKKPALDFTESLPLGNGRIGAMVFGRTERERIALNEISLWSGGPQDADMDSAWVYLKPIQNLLLLGKNKDAQDLLMKHFVAKGRGSGFGNGANDKYGSYQTFGDFNIDWFDGTEETTDYLRCLDLETATSTTCFTRRDSRIVQEVFTDYKNDVLWIKLTSGKDKVLRFNAHLSRKENVLANKRRNTMLVLEGRLPSGKDRGMKYAAVAKIVKTDGKFLIGDSVMRVTDASECLIAISLRTSWDYAHYRLMPEETDVVSLAVRDIDKASTNFNKNKKNSAQAYQALFNRCRWTIPGPPSLSHASTPERLQAYSAGGSDPALPLLYFNYGRYLLISSSRPGLLPSNLQGLWAEEYQAPWNGDYHLNINIQMNYWPADVTNLSALNEPLFRFTKMLMENGARTAKAYYNAPGWVAHVISNPWLYTSPGEGAQWGSTLTGGAWLATHIWDSYRFNRQVSLLEEYFPVMSGAARFLSHILIKEPKNGWLVTAPSNSPENAYRTKEGFTGYTCMGPTMDMQISRHLFGAVLKCAAILHRDAGLEGGLQQKLAGLAPNQVSPSNGGIQEWLEDYETPEPQHRHISHLYGLCPYDEINARETPQLMEAARKTLVLRGDEATGWSKAWKINFWARMGDGNHALLLFNGLLKPVSRAKGGGSGSYPNLFDAHPPFQIDGNFGGTAGLAEMLIQSHGKDEAIRFLPALPDHKDWAAGHITGLRARGNRTVSMTWENSRLSSAEIKCGTAGPSRIFLPEGKNVYDPSGRRLTLSPAADGMVEFQARANSVYTVR